MSNIGFILNKISSIGGIERITSILANEFVKDNNVFIFTFEKNSNFYYQLDNRVKVNYLKDNFKKIKKLFAVRSELKQHKIDFLIIQDKELGFLSYLRFNKFFHTKIIFCDHLSFNHYFKNNVKNEIERRRKYTKYADAVVVLTSDNVELYKNLFKYKDNKVFLIPNFVDFDNKHNKYNYESKTIVAVGRLHTQKRFDLMIDAFSRVNKKYPEWKLEIYGEGNERENLSKLIEKFHLENNVFLMGQYSNIDNAYLNKSFLCASSEFEGFGIMILEALKYNLPIVTFNCLSGPSDMVSNGYNGFLAKPLDVDDLSNQICNLINDKDLRIKFSENSCKMSSKFSKKTVLDSWNKIFKYL